MNQEELKESVRQTLELWSEQKPNLEKAYAVRDESRMLLLKPAIEQLERLIRQSGTEEHPHTNRIQYVLEPYNYTERIEFIKLQNTSHYALVQLTMLYDEVKKKAARLRVQR
ncbi:hypothetical protein HMPREF9372_0426 [Sporosarcina newyorkensis 2681]|uniref:YpoC-like domain-containing protein n=1 Tax=Sporosarcina newyorkensis 2681 TaxID=1027292 RepID=F9DNP6_9BACL|nr:hypothetical protein [Sporosarcina newyorkensis]EGQ27539.1 hypothetical protein HMPREF9372_0426 [Sporosarcina newyorkensis 2681]